MKKVITATRENRTDDSFVNEAIDSFEKAGDDLLELLAKYTKLVSMEDKGVLNDEELEQIGDVADMLHDAAHYLSMSE